MNNKTLQELKKFYLLPSTAKILPIGSGHINDTYMIESSDQSFVAQRINNVIFPEPELLIENFKTIADFLDSKQLNQQYIYDVVRPVGNSQGDLYYIDSQNNYWRAITLVENSHSIQSVTDKRYAFEAAKAFASFTHALSGLQANALNITIANFHDLQARLDLFDIALAAATEKTKEQAANTIKFVLDVGKNMLAEFQQLVARGLQLTIVHNDTKLNNILFDNNQLKARAVVDLDTVMAGYLLYDFGDMVRTMAMGCVEDDPLFSSYNINFDIVESLAKGYGHVYSKSNLSQAELDSFKFAAKYMSFIIGLRFTTDFLNNNIYFKIQYDSHNLVRAQNQFYLTELLTANQDKIDKIVEQNFV